MTSDTRTASLVLDQLDTACRDSLDRLRMALSSAVEEPATVVELRNLISGRENFLDDLEREIGSLGSKPSEGLSPGRGVRKLLTSAKALLARDALQVHLEECHLGCSFLIRDYENATKLRLPTRTHQLVTRQLAGLREDLETLRSLVQAHGGEVSASPDDGERPGRLDCAGLTDRGRVRGTNQDQFLIAELRKSMRIHQSSLEPGSPRTLVGHSPGQLLVVADGMGGHAAGEEASAVAIEGLRHHVLEAMPWFLQLEEADEDRIRECLGRAMRVCQERIQQSVRAHPERSGMGTTLTLAYIQWPHLYVVHAGDSRCYVKRGGRLERMTVDHTLAQQLVDLGRLTEEEASRSGRGDVLWNVLGGFDDTLEADVYTATLAFGDVLLLCSDGLTRHVTDARLTELLDAGRGARHLARQLVEEALEAGGEDNITVVVGRFESASEGEDGSEDPGEGEERGLEMPVRPPEENSTDCA